MVISFLFCLSLLQHSFIALPNLLYAEGGRGGGGGGGGGCREKKKTSTSNEITKLRVLK